MKQTIQAAAAILRGGVVAGAVLLGCGLFQPGARAAEISVTQWGQSMYGAPYAVALHDGLFKPCGDIDGIIGSAGGGSTVRNMMASDLPYAEVAFPAAVAAIAHHLDVIIVNVGTDTPAGASVVTTKTSAIHTLADLAGHKVAITTPRASSEMLLLMELQHKGIDPASVHRVASGGYVQGLSMLDSGEVDAAVLIEPLAIRRRDDYRTVVRAEDILPPMTMSVGITTRAFASAHPDTLRCIIGQRRKAVERLYAAPAEAATILAEVYHMPPELARVAIDNMVKAHMWSDGAIDTTELNRAADGLKLIGELKGDIDWNTAVNSSFLN
ncbi:ABC transporter substrate-binding protein [Acetobacter sp. TBRC 12305]|uniref:ABC transporter substrate-binding protein n=1 Tax=Acetobacter garciniae TaxID=2817435 RepID=A0A939HMB6_9PROT|nr:ABC transporter substrate-binding protein [Acetobacter garciniae]MBO1325515.1 ABC transporter substrate-binding protein [Acetobacter garciniae]MBX0345313.1 ABC transporter substrate-binding protein [Acetobacter garciniae]